MERQFKFNLHLVFMQFSNKIKYIEKQTREEKIMELLSYLKIN